MPNSSSNQGVFGLILYGLEKIMARNICLAGDLHEC